MKYIYFAEFPAFMQSEADVINGTVSDIRILKYYK